MVDFAGGERFEVGGMKPNDWHDIEDRALNKARADEQQLEAQLKVWRQVEAVGEFASSLLVVQAARAAAVQHEASRSASRLERRAGRKASLHRFGRWFLDRAMPGTSEPSPPLVGPPWLGVELSRVLRRNQERQEEERRREEGQS